MEAATFGEDKGSDSAILVSLQEQLKKDTMQIYNYLTSRQQMLLQMWLKTVAIPLN